MPPYRSPEVGSFFAAKYIRIGSELWMTKKNDLDTSALALADRDGILEKFESAARVEPDSVYAGTFTVTGATIYVNHQAPGATLDYTPTEQGFSQTVETFQSQNPQFEVIKGM